MAPADGQGWFDAARFGMLVSWGASSAGGLEPSSMVDGDLTVGEYDEVASQFDPPAGVAGSWASLARQAGMRYLVLTAKHLDGCTLFPQGRSGFGIQRVDPERDVVREVVEAARAEGLRVGLSYSLSDWHHPDYPAFVDDLRPYAGAFYPRSEPARWEAYLRDVEGELDHLLTAYGPIDHLRFDGGWERTPEEWRSTELEARVRARQPSILLDDGLPGAGEVVARRRPWPQAPAEARWEVRLGMEEHGSTRAILVTLLDVVAAGGNLLLEVSPDGDGIVPDWQEDRLLEIAGWMRLHGHAVVGSVPSTLHDGQFHGPSTSVGASTFLFCTMRPEELVVLRGVDPDRIRAVRAVGTGIPLEVTPQVSPLDRLLGDVDPLCDVHLAVPEAAIDPLITVIEVVTGA